MISSILKIWKETIGFSPGPVNRLSIDQNSLTMQMFWFIMSDRLSAEKAKLESELENERKSTVEKILLLQESESRLK